jgi:glutathione peroxidase
LWRPRWEVWFGLEMKIILVFVVLLTVLLVVGLKYRSAFSADETRVSTADAGSLYALSTATLSGEPVDLDVYNGKVTLVVNTASKCGLTPQYAGIEALYRELSSEGFVVLGFPSNDFMGQEPGSPEEIALFCSENYDITFPLFNKVKVKGDDRCEIYKLLTAELEEPTWNFTKYLVDKEGHVVARFGPRTKPDDEGLRAAIELELKP